MSIQSPLEGMMTLEMGLEDISLGTKDDEEQVEDDDDASSSTSTSTIRAGDSIDHEPVPATKAGPSDELERFRREWKREMETKKDVGGVNVGPVRWKRDDPSSSAAPATTSSSKNMTGPSRRGAPLSPDVPWRALPQDLDGPPQEVQPQPQPRPLDSLPPVRPPGGRRKGLLVGKEREDAAVQMYARAVENEQAGQLNDALMLYRQAFKLNDHVDRLYTRSSAVKARAEEDEAPKSTDIVSSSAPKDEPYSFQRHIQMAPDYDSAATPLPSSSDTSLPPSQLTTLLDTQDDIDSTPFSPKEENFPLPIDKLPPELLESIFSHLDVISIERFGAVSWKARYLTAKSEMWKRVVKGIYRPPAMIPQKWIGAGGDHLRDTRGEESGDAGSKPKDLEIIGRQLIRRHGGEWRTALIEEERVRMDGCYIAVCHYVRPGSGDEWIAITHMITYHRFLRFYPDGSVISFLTTDHPSEVVPVLRPSLRAKGLHFGQWRLIRSDQQSDPPNPNTPADKTRPIPRAKILVTDLLEPSSSGSGPKYEFEMELALRETGRGRWNKLDILAYRSINLSNGEILGLTLKHQRPFYFSKVKSYHPSL